MKWHVTTASFTKKSPTIEVIGYPSSAVLIAAMQAASDAAFAEGTAAGLPAGTLYAKMTAAEQKAIVDAKAAAASTEKCPNRAFNVRIYYYSPTAQTIGEDHTGQSELTVSSGTGGIETFTETVKFVYGKGSLTKTDVNGIKNLWRPEYQALITKDELITYDVAYIDYGIISTTEGNKSVLFFLTGTPHEAESIYDFTVAPCGVCDAENLDQCETQVACEAVGGHWYGSPAACHAEPETPVCDLAHPELCLTEETCNAVSGLSWYGGECHVGEIPLKTITVESWNEKDGVHVVGDRVYLDSVDKGATDSGGFLTITNVPLGVHTLKMAKPGLQDTDLDALANDSIEVVV